MSVDVFLCLCFWCMIVADVVVSRWEPDWIDTWEFYYGLLYLSVTVLWASYCIATDQIEVATYFLIIATWYGFMWWNRTRKRRKRLADRASGMVVDVGGRLKVVREPVTE